MTRSKQSYAVGEASQREGFTLRYQALHPCGRGQSKIQNSLTNAKVLCR
ncbi:hypothetical protein NIES50_42520 [Aulosira laxa NIES-50]|nr:hypothetical protein NIES50_42520 [Aulosira laxa NIES-50]